MPPPLNDVHLLLKGKCLSLFTDSILPAPTMCGFFSDTQEFTVDTGGHPINLSTLTLST